MASSTVMIIGFGKVARWVVDRLKTTDKKITALMRDTTQSDSLRSVGIDVIHADLNVPDSLKALDVNDREVYFFAPPSRSDDSDHHMRNFLAAIKRQAPRKILYISTTAVYGNSHGDWVTESAPTVPTTERGLRRQDAEQQLQIYAAEKNIPFVILRVGGIYGPDRLPLRQLESGRPVLNDEDSGYTNRIHADDLAGICVTAMEKGEGIYNVSDGKAGTMAEYFIALAEALGYPIPDRISLEQAREIMSPEMMSYLEESRRLDVSRLLDELGVVLRYPDLASGIAQIKKHIN